MDNTELHYVSYDPDEILLEMMTAYMQAGGDTLYAGDEKEMLLQAVLQIMVQAFAGIDNALRMDTLRYATREYLDIYGEKRNCIRIAAQAATATIKITLGATGMAGTIPAGTIVTADGTVLYRTVEELAITGEEQELTTMVECSQTGSMGNGLTAGTDMQLIVPIEGVTAIQCTMSASGGQDTESDEAYRERIRTYGLTSVTTGPQQQYESAAKAASSEVVDARAINQGAGKVNVYIIAAGGASAEPLLTAIDAALNDREVRPLTDEVRVLEAVPVSYTLNVRYSYDGSSGVQTLISEAIQEYKEWQESSVGRAFNPDKLQAALYTAGATRVIWGAGSEFNGGSTIGYTEIEPYQYCKGSISQAVIGT